MDRRLIDRGTDLAGLSGRYSRWRRGERSGPGTTPPPTSAPDAMRRAISTAAPAGAGLEIAINAGTGLRDVSCQRCQVRLDASAASGRPHLLPPPRRPWRGSLRPSCQAPASRPRDRCLWAAVGLAASAGRMRWANFISRREFLSHLVASRPDCAAISSGSRSPASRSPEPAEIEIGHRTTLTRCGWNSRPGSPRPAQAKARQSRRPIPSSYSSTSDGRQRVESDAPFRRRADDEVAGTSGGTTFSILSMEMTFPLEGHVPVLQADPLVGHRKWRLAPRSPDDSLAGVTSRRPWHGPFERLHRHAQDPGEPASTRQVSLPAPAMGSLPEEPHSQR